MRGGTVLPLKRQGKALPCVVITHIAASMYAREERMPCAEHVPT